MAGWLGPRADPGPAGLWPGPAGSGPKGYNDPDHIAMRSSLRIGFTFDRRDMMFIPSPLRLRTVGATVLAVSALLALSACSSAGKVGETVSSLGGMLTPYQSDVLQGNVVTREQVQALQTGMPREQVRNILGTPLLASAFHADRWDYVFSFRRQGQPVQQRKVTLFFKRDVLERVQADDLPSEQEFVSSLDVRRKGAKVPPLVATEAELKAFAEKNRAAEPEKTVPAAAPAASYPPLESR